MLINSPIQNPVNPVITDKCQKLRHLIKTNYGVTVMLEIFACIKYCISPNFKDNQESCDF